MIPHTSKSLKTSQNGLGQAQGYAIACAKRGMTPISSSEMQKVPAEPTEYVLPEPVWPYAKRDTLYLPHNVWKVHRWFRQRQRSWDSGCASRLFRGR